MKLAPRTQKTVHRPAFYPGGEYIFQKHFTAPQAWQGKPVSLVFEGVYQTALVYA